MYTIERGQSRPLGANPDEHGVNFSLFSEHATAVELLLFAKSTDEQPVQTILLDQINHRTFHFWHVYVRGARPGMYYAYRVAGPASTEKPGDRFNINKVLIDPYGKSVSTELWLRRDAVHPNDNCATAMRSVIVDISHYDWEDDQPLNHPMSESIIYEVHVGGFTRSPTTGCAHPGTFSALIEKIPYLQALGITAVELMPVFAFDPTSVGRTNPLTNEVLTNYWGYDPINHFAPHPAYCVDTEATQHINEFRDLVKAFHRAGIEVLLDIVFNHTGEGDEHETTLSFKGIDNRIYYFVDPQNPNRYLNYSGCGNTMNCNHPVVEKLIIECLVFWVQEMHVDGFRFDEGSILTRGIDGRPMEYPPVLWNIELNDVLAGTKIIAEPWDASGLYQVGNFPGYRWAVWNGQYRDVIRRFVKGDSGLIGVVASRLGGSQDIFCEPGQRPTNGINFITCHDGFTLYDLVSYNEKHNLENGEDNRDGWNSNASWNCGVEGETANPDVLALRARQMRNFLTILFLSQGVPMLLAGDEVCRTQRGNNNAYCQDNEISWFDWRLPMQQSDLLRFVRMLIALRKQHANLHRIAFFSGTRDKTGRKDIEWHGCRLLTPEWDNPAARTLAFTIRGDGECTDIHVMMNMDEYSHHFELPFAQKQAWRMLINTAFSAPWDICEEERAQSVYERSYCVEGRSIIVLLAK